MRKDGYVVVQPWMVTDYNLNGNKLLIYALIWGFHRTNSLAFMALSATLWSISS